MNHTPGPWEIKPRIHAEMFAAIMGADGHLVVNLGDGGNGIERQTANAQLIAAAPELLGALKVARQVILDECTESLIPPGEGCQLMVTGKAADILHTIDAAIAKAEGKAVQRT